MPNENAEQIAGAVAERAFWSIPGSPATVTYSLRLFHEIDFAVNEGYRKISHGGIEVGGLLFGSISEKGPSIEAFRNIECEHASGPSFLLSDHDLQALEQQIQASASDPGLEGLRPIGWFVAHTRGPLQVTDQEFEIFGRLFKSAGELTLIVKPERFKPTLFGFLVRDQSGAVGRDASEQAIILPLPGRSQRASSPEPVPAILAPKNSVTPRPARPEKMPAAESLANSGAAEPISSIPARDSHESSHRAARRQKLEQARLQEEAEAQANRTEESEGVVSAVSQAKAAEGNLAETRQSSDAELPPAMALVPTKTRKRAKPAAASRSRSKNPNPYAQLEQLGRERTGPGPSSRLTLVLPLAALFGSVVGYLTYLQIPSPVIPLNARGLAQTVLVSWPPAETRKAVYAAIRVDDSAPVLLSPEEKATGEVELSATSDMKIELITRNWMRDSRGIVRFVKAGTERQQSNAP